MCNQIASIRMYVQYWFTIQVTVYCCSVNFWGAYGGPPLMRYCMIISYQIIQCKTEWQNVSKMYPQLFWFAKMEWSCGSSFWARSLIENVTRPPFALCYRPRYVPSCYTEWECHEKTEIILGNVKYGMKEGREGHWKTQQECETGWFLNTL